MDLKLAVAVAVVMLAAGVLILQRRRGRVRIDEGGILIARSLASPLYLPWSDIERFGIASVSRIEGGLYQPGFSQCVGVLLTDSSALKATRRCSDNRRLSDYDVLLTPEPGMSVDRYAAYLEGEKARLKKG